MQPQKMFNVFKLFKFLRITTTTKISNLKIFNCIFNQKNGFLITTKKSDVHFSFSVCVQWLVYYYVQTNKQTYKQI